MIQFLIILLGLVIGSFLNYVIYRLSIEGHSFLKDFSDLKNRSYCPNCKHNLSWKDLFPVFSFTFLGGRCRYCKEKISWQYPLVEISTALIFLLIYSQKMMILDTIYMFYIACVLIIIFAFDFKHYLIPDKILFPAIFISFAYNWIFHSDNLMNYILAAILSSLFFLIIYLISKGNWMGFGDVKLAILLGLILGFPGILAGLFLAFLIGAIIGLIVIFLGKKGLKSEVPFAPFLITGTFLSVFWGQDIINWYLNFILS